MSRFRNIRRRWYVIAAIAVAAGTPASIAIVRRERPDRQAEARRRELEARAELLERQLDAMQRDLTTRGGAQPLPAAGSAAVPPKAE